MNTRFVRHDFAETLFAGHAAAGDGVAPRPPWGRARPSLQRDDPVDELRRADAADWTLLRLVFCAAIATLLLALACGLAE